MFMRHAWRDQRHVFHFTASRSAILPPHPSVQHEETRMKTHRHTAIKDLLVKTSVTNQDELRRKLAAKGFHVTQATLSRDIRDLKLMKGPAGYALPSDGEDDLPETASVLQDFGLSVVQAQNLVVVRTIMGGAQPVAASIDSEDWDEVVGTIAGDDTVLIICPDSEKAEILKKRIEVHLG
jgi:transcriptional regulator of arginine metabolism